MPDQVPEEVKRERIERLVETVQRVAAARNARAGRPRPGGARRGAEPHRPALLRGRTRRNTTVNFSGTARPGELVDVADRRRDLDDAARRAARRSSPPRAMAIMTRSGWDGCINVRDLGGHPTRDGGETRYGAVVRADSVSLLSEAGWEALVDYGVRTVLDLRRTTSAMTIRRASCPSRSLHVPFMEASDEEWEEIGPEIDAGSAGPRPTSRPRRATSTSSSSSASRADIAAALPAVANAPEGGVVVHCVGGKDRTGLLVALPAPPGGRRRRGDRGRLRAQRGAPAPRHEAWFAAADSEEEPRAPPPDRPDAGGVNARRLRELERRYGSIEAYLPRPG